MIEFPRRHQIDRRHRASAVGEAIPPGPLIDVGAGACFLEQFAEGCYYPVDVTTDALEAGPRRSVATISALPFRDGAATTTTCVSVLQYVLDVHGALTELRRVTRVGGGVMILVPNLGYLRNIAKLLRGRFPWSSPVDDWRGGTIRYFTRRDLTVLCTNVGLEVRRVRCSGRFRRFRSLSPALLGADLLFELERLT